VKLHRAADRRKVGRFLVEGSNSVGEALADGRAVDFLYTAEAAERYADLVRIAEEEGVRSALVSDKAARALAETVTSPGVFAVCELLDAPLAQVVSGASLLAVPVEAGEPGNAGAIIRIADAVGAQGVVLAGPSVDPHNGKAVRASAGSVFHVPFARETDVPKVLQSLREAGFLILATAADGEVSLDAADGLLAGKTAWLFGAEAHGLPPEVAAAADHRVRIPIRGRAESLNLATAAAICLYASAKVQAAQQI
jgi:TrmH family RNA methyltransferase